MQSLSAHTSPTRRCRNDRKALSHLRQIGQMINRDSVESWLFSRVVKTKRPFEIAGYDFLVSDAQSCRVIKSRLA